MTKVHKVDPKKGGVQWIFSNQDVALRSVLVLGDDPSADGEDRVEGREPEPLSHQKRLNKGHLISLLHPGMEMTCNEDNMPTGVFRGGSSSRST